MTQITFDKTWLVKELFIDSGGSLTNNKLSILGIKNLMVEAGWSVVSSSNATIADSNDNWNSVSDITWATGNHSWVVLKNTAIASNFQICIDLATSLSAYLWCFVSYNSGFSGGTISSRPTASDEIDIITSANVWDAQYSSLTYKKITYLYSSDLKCNRIHLSFGGSTIGSNSVSFIMFDVPKDAPSWWDTPFIACFGGDNRRITYTNYNTTTTTPLFGIIDGQKINLAIGSWGAGKAYGNTVIGMRPDYGGSYSLSPMVLISNTSSRPGMLGVIVDMWWVSAGLPEGTYIPTIAGPRSLFVIGNAAHATNGNNIGI